MDNEQPPPALEHETEEVYMDLTPMSFVEFLCVIESSEKEDN